MSKHMKIRLLGVRGSRPTHKRALLGYGGNSTSFEIIVPDSNFHLFIDGGSGLAHRGFAMGQDTQKKIFHCLITHTHWDHILGFPFFQPLYNPNNEFHFYASDTTRSTFHELFFGLQRNGNLPVPPKCIKAKIHFHTVLADSTFSVGQNTNVSTYQLNHQGITLGYRIEKDDSSVVIITDNAPIENGNYMGEGMREKAAPDKKKFETEFDAKLVAFLKDAHTVIFDTHFTEKNLLPNWGHSTPPRALDFCKKADVKRLVLFHHAPEDTDQHVDDKVQSIFHDACHAGIEVEAAREGDEWDLCA